MKRRDLLALAVTAAGAPLVSRADAPPPRYFVLTHAPGPAWDHTKHFRDQPGIAQHIGYMQGFADKGRIIMGGPFLDDTGGMMIFDVPTLEDAHAIAEADPTVKAGLLIVTAKPWLVALSRP